MEVRDKMEATQELSPQYQLHKTIDFSGRKATLLLQVVAIPLLIAYLALFLFIAVNLQPALFAEPLTFDRPFLIIAVGLVLIVLQIIVHELLHGVFFWYFTGARPVFGFSWTYAYAGAPDWYLPRNPFIITTLAPFMVITLVGLPLLALASLPVVMGTLLILVLNAAGSLGDHYVALQLLREPKTTLSNDTGFKITFYRLESPDM